MSTVEPSFEDTEQLIQQAQEGSDQCLQALFERYLPIVHLIVAQSMGLLRSQLQDREDVVQEVMLKALANLGSFQAKSEGSFRHWLATIVRHRLIDLARRRNARPEMRQADLPSTCGTDFVGHSHSTPSKWAAAHELDEKLERTLLSLPERHRRVFVLRRFCAMSYEEIAEEMQLGRASSARAAYSRSMIHINRALGDAGSGHFARGRQNG